MTKYKLSFILFWGGAGGILLAISFVNPYGGKISLSEFVLQLSGSRGEFALGLSMPELVSLITRMLPMYIFQVYFGTVLYRHFCTASIYVFSRYPKRVRWYLRETLWVGILACLFQIVILATASFLTVIRFQLRMDWAGIVLLAYHFLIHTAWLSAMTLSVNLLAISIGSSASFMMVISFQVICITLLGCVGTFQRYLDVTAFSEIFLVLNPISHLVLGWQSSKNGAMNQALHSPYSVLDLNHSVLFTLFLSVVITLWGVGFIKNHDFLTADLEMGG
ncbi:MAG: hypothetical protein LBQ15_03405 [Clostridium sp.]|nr:hypothetical protein [Clostridium sp.]